MIQARVTGGTSITHCCNPGILAFPRTAPPGCTAAILSRVDAGYVDSSSLRLCEIDLAQFDPRSYRMCINGDELSLCRMLNYLDDVEVAPRSFA